MLYIALVVVVGLACLAAGYTVKTILDRHALREAGDITKNARREAEALVKEGRIAAKEELLKSREEFERSTKDRRQEIQKLEERLAAKEANAERKADLVESRMAEIDRRDTEVRGREEVVRKEADRLDGLIRNEVQKLEQIASLSQEQARRQLLDRLSESLEAERGALIRRFQEENQQRLLNEAQEVMITAIGSLR